MILCALTVLILAAFWVALPGRFQANQSYDYRCCYEPSARNLVAGNGFIYDNGKFAMHYPPGLPLFLALVYSLGKWIGEGTALSLFIAVCDVAAVLAAYATGRALNGPWMGRLAGLGLITYPFFLWMSKQPNPEVPFLPFVLWGFYCYVRMVAEGERTPEKWAAWCGVFWALAALVRPIAILGAVVMAGCAVLFAHNLKPRRRLALAAILVAANVATVMPWEIIAKNATGKWILLAGANAVGYQDGLTFGLSRFDHPAKVDPDVFQLMERAAAQLPRLETTGGYLGFLKEEAQQHPAAFAKLMLVKILRAWYATYEGYFEGVNAVVSLLYIGAGGAGLWWMRRRYPAVVWAILAVVLYFWAMSVVVMPILRYMVPATAFLIVAAAYVARELLVHYRWIAPEALRPDEAFSQ